jgi:Ssp1 endopeptidase immunity protein Rap1a
MGKIAIALAVTLGFVAAIRAESAVPYDDTGNALLPSCREWVDRKAPHTKDDAALQGLCAGLIVGTGRFSAQRGIPANFRSCTPLETTNDQLIRVVVRFMENHPERLQLPLVILTILALQEAWPCKDEPAK